MRDIVFRAKRKDTGEWAYGIPFPHGYKGLSMFRQHTVDGSLVGENADFDTLGQYTGLRDKHGVRIFEGDIVRCNNEIYVIGYYESFAAYTLKSPCNMRQAPPITSITTRNLEIIGNIHDNPELLEGEI